MWFTSQGRHPAIGRITTRGRITLFSRGLRRGSTPFGIAATSHGLWFTDHGCAGGGRCQLGRVTPAGQISESRSGLRTDTDPLAMTAGFGGSVWFADGAGSIGEIGSDGRDQRTRTAGRQRPGGDRRRPRREHVVHRRGQPPGGGTDQPGGRGADVHRRAVRWQSPGGDRARPRTAACGSRTKGESRRSAGSPPERRRRWARCPHSDGRARPGQTLTCPHADVHRAWDQLAPVAPAFGFDGDRWLRDGIATGVRGPQYRVRSRDAGHRLACRVTATYPTPFLTTAVGLSPAVTARR